jgi:hypothetical protein
MQPHLSHRSKNFALQSETLGVWVTLLRLFRCTGLRLLLPQGAAAFADDQLVTRMHITFDYFRAGTVGGAELDRDRCRPSVTTARPPGK